jgi:hypothetical protein
MNISQIETVVKYITNSHGEKTDVIVPMGLWHILLAEVTSGRCDENKFTESGLDPIDENEPNTKILADLQASIRAVKAGETYPVSQLWGELDD